MPSNSPTLTLAKELIAYPSVTPADGGCFKHIENYLSPLGFHFEYLRRGSTTNVWARHGAAKPLFCFAGHVDVVPPGPLECWTSPPFTPTVRDGRLYGRGAADMKSSIAAMLTATREFILSHPDYPGSIAFLLTSDEEGDALDGTTAVVDRLAARGEFLDYCIIGEPTAETRLGDMIKNGRRGSLSGKLRVRGIQCHIAYPEQGRNPIHQLGPVLAELAETIWDEGNAFFQPTSWQVSNIHGGTGANNVIPEHVELWFNFRFSTASTPESLQETFVRILKRHELEYELEWTLGARPFLTEPGPLANAAIQAIQAETGIQTRLSTTGGTSDGRFITRICSQMLELGPVNASSHKIDEWIDIEALPKLSGIYHRILKEIFHV